MGFDGAMCLCIPPQTGGKSEQEKEITSITKPYSSKITNSLWNKQLFVSKNKPFAPKKEISSSKHWCSRGNISLSVAGTDY